MNYDVLYSNNKRQFNNARIEIVPSDDNYISIFEKAEYASQVNVSIAR